jgi:hypothetical protein
VKNYCCCVPVDSDTVFDFFCCCVLFSHRLASGSVDRNTVIDFTLLCSHRTASGSVGRDTVFDITLLCSFFAQISQWFSG